MDASEERRVRSRKRLPKRKDHEPADQPGRGRPRQAAGTSVATSTLQFRNYARHWTPLHLDFVVDDINLAIQRALLAGAKQERAVTTHPYGKLALMADPFGHGFCLIQFTGRGYDEVVK